MTTSGVTERGEYAMARWVQMDAMALMPPVDRLGRRRCEPDSVLTSAIALAATNTTSSSRVGTAFWPSYEHAVRGERENWLIPRGWRGARRAVRGAGAVAVLGAVGSAE